MEARELRSVIEAATRAAAVGDHSSAEQLLRDAASSQEAAFGPLDPGLANILNNLAVVCEMLEKPADAERFYRRACAIASAVLEPDHSFVATSRKNLSDFCEARGIPVELPPLQSVEAARESLAPHSVRVRTSLHRIELPNESVGHSVCPQSLQQRSGGNVSVVSDRERGATLGCHADLCVEARDRTLLPPIGGEHSDEAPLSAWQRTRTARTATA